MGSKARKFSYWALKLSYMIFRCTFSTPNRAWLMLFATVTLHSFQDPTSANKIKTHLAALRLSMGTRRVTMRHCPSRLTTLGSSPACTSSFTFRASRPAIVGQVLTSHHVPWWDVIYFDETQISFLRHVQNAFLSGTYKPLLLSFFSSPSCKFLYFDIKSNLILTESCFPPL